MIKHLLMTTCITISVIAALLYVIQLSTPHGTIMVYDCRLVEISPDFPIEVKKACRDKIGRI